MNKVETPVYINVTKRPHYLNLMSFEFHILGCGGTGSFLVRDLARLLGIKHQDTNNRTFGTMFLYDGDIVEEKNIARQNFIQSDVGKNKAEVLQKRYTNAFNAPIVAVPKYIESPEEIYRIYDNANTNDSVPTPVIISCVDNVATRKIISNAIFSVRSYAAPEIRNITWIDSGNEEWSGQVVLTKKTQFWDAGPYVDQDHVFMYNFNTPTVFDLYPNMLSAKDKLSSELSCAERAVSNPQNIATNITAANIIFQMVNNILNRKINYYHVSFNSKYGNTKTDYITKSMLEKYERLHKERILSIYESFEVLHKKTRLAQAIQEYDDTHSMLLRFDQSLQQLKNLTSTNTIMMGKDNYFTSTYISSPTIGLPPEITE